MIRWSGEDSDEIHRCEKLHIDNYVWVPEAYRDSRITAVELDVKGNDIFFRVRLDHYPENSSLLHHTAVRPSKSLDEIVEFFLNDPKTKVFINHNNDTGE